MKTSKIEDFLYNKFFKSRNRNSFYRKYYGLYRTIRLKKKDPIIHYKNREYEIFLPLSQNLFFYQESYPYFDKRLRQISNYMKKIEKTDQLIIVDIGANIGDTILEMGIENYKDYYIAIEGEKKYNSLLEKNLKINNILNYEIYTCYLSDNIENMNVNTLCQYGTNRLVTRDVGDLEICMETLDHLLCQRKKNIDLIKIDTDGFDYKILRGSKEIIQSDKPVIYFEWGIDFWIEAGEDLYEIFDYLFFLGYENGLFFDNYGNVVEKVQLCDSNTIQKMIEDVFSPENNIEYYDVLVFHEKSPYKLNDFLSKGIKEIYE